MKDRYWLVEVDNDQLVAALSGLVRREHDLLSDLLAHLAELEERRLYLELGYSSLFAYCTEKFEFSHASAGRRIAAARLCRAYPELFERVAHGHLQLTALCLLAQHTKSNLTPENARELFEACSHQSGDQVELLLATRFPQPDVRESIRRLPARAVPPAPVAQSSPEPLVASMPPTASAASAASAAPPRADATLPEQATRGSCPQLAGEFGRARAALGRVEPLASDRFGVHFTADTEFRELLEEVRALRSHVDPKADLAAILKRSLQAYRRELLKSRFGVGRKPRRAPNGKAKLGNAKRSRHIPSAVARKVYLRDDGRCTFCAANGRRCDSRDYLQLDHVIPWAVTGEPSAANLRMRCRAHNLHAARSYFGPEHIRGAVERARSSGRSARLSPVNSADNRIPASEVLQDRKRR